MASVCWKTWVSSGPARPNWQTIGVRTASAEGDFFVVAE